MQLASKPSQSSIIAVVLLLLATAQMALASSAQKADSSDDPDARPPVTQADLEIVKRAEKILSLESKWNRHDNRSCPPDAKTVSIYCALRQATFEVTGNWEHRGAAMQEARFAIEEIAPNRRYQHRLMDFNNDASTSFGEVQKFFRLLEKRIAKRLKEEHSHPK